MRQELAAHTRHTLGSWPLLLSLARGLLETHLRYGRDREQVLEIVEQISQARPVDLRHSQTSAFQDAIEASIQVSLRQMQQIVAPRYQPLERFQELAIFPEDTDIPIEVLRLFWRIEAGLARWEVDYLCMQFQSLSLVLHCDLSADTLRLHVSSQYIGGTPTPEKTQGKEGSGSRGDDRSLQRHVMETQA